MEYNNDNGDIKNDGDYTDQNLCICLVNFRYDEIKEKLTPYLKRCGFNPKTDLYYLPVSGLNGVNLKDKSPEVCPWYE